jgi:hypothetical protein
MAQPNATDASAPPPSTRSVGEAVAKAVAGQKISKLAAQRLVHELEKGASPVHVRATTTSHQSPATSHQQQPAAPAAADTTTTTNPWPLIRPAETPKELQRGVTFLTRA